MLNYQRVISATLKKTHYKKSRRLREKSPFSTNHVAIPTRARILLDWWVISLALTSLTPLTPLTLNLTGARAALAFFVAAVAARLEESLSGNRVGSIFYIQNVGA
jgi:hypothetical protein